MSEHYQELDAPHFDYQLGTVAGIDAYRFRGPIPNLEQPYIACLGGAQAFGRFVVEAFPAMLGRELGLPCVNLGMGGSGPRFAFEPGVLPVLQRAQLVIVQMFSGRSASNSLFDNSNGGRNYGRVVGTDAWQPFEQFFTELMSRADVELLRRVVRETRDDYAFYMRALAKLLPAPKVLFWWSRRAPDYTVDWARLYGILAEYPQLIDRDGIDRMRVDFDAYVQCIGDIGLPQRLWRGDAAVLGTDRSVDGHVWNRYYPSPEMHAEAAARLLPVCRRLLGAAPSTG